MSECDEIGVSNNSFFRGKSNALDCIPGFKDSSLWANIHGWYHDKVADEKEKSGNYEGATAERKRDQEQYYKANQGGRNSDSDSD